MSPFGQAIDQWHDFFVSLITASSTLLGLLFIGISLNPARMKDETDYRGTALQTFTSFIYTLFIAFLFVVPDQTVTGLGLPLLVLGLFGLLQTLQNTSTAIRKQTHLWNSRRLVMRFGWSMISFIVMIIVGGTVLAGQTNGIYWLVPAVLILIGGACTNAWQLLINTAKVE